ncbi:hypothetical protein CC80DRAFT_543105 [Byssothecium circinans]|uniref:AMP-activated protein kinase glycogen-binding domain-containing protein n=1 Tax=Byssothecium circinans TaxID=147558 RepID=A0A6A5U9Z9_9PLEO|nr:hypothetical protein CC80DRAFT_543105 [Byssothecium circinans]
MARATITFASSNVQGRPVYVVTDMTSPPWEAVELHDSGERTESGEIVYAHEFQGDFAEGDHPYKIRIGDNEWIVDPTQRTMSDSGGNVNNVVRAETDASTSTSPLADTGYLFPHEQAAQGHSEQSLLLTPSSSALASSSSSVSSPSLPGPSSSLTVSSSSLFPASLHAGRQSGRLHSYHADSEPSELPFIEEESESNASSSTAVDHETPAPDTIPINDNNDEVNEDKSSSSSSSGESDDEYHDDWDGDDDDRPGGGHVAAAGSSSARMSSDDSQNTSSNEAPLMPHETTPSDETQDAEVDDTMLLSHESAAPTDSANAGELANAPSFSFEAGPSSTDETSSERAESGGEPAESQPDSSLEEERASSDEDESESDRPSQSTYDDELDRPPALSHEPGAGSEDSFPSEPGTARVFLYEASSPERDVESEDSALIYAFSPQRRNMAGAEEAEDELERGFSLSHEQTFPAEFASEYPGSVAEGKRPVNIDGDGEGSLPNPHSPIFRRASSGIFRKPDRNSLPHGMARTDDEDPEIKAGGLEMFPTNRDKIFMQIKSTSSKLAEDITEGASEDDMNSPGRSNGSQACSSVELLPIRSHTSLAAIEESAAQEEEEAIDAEPPLPGHDGARDEAGGLANAHNGTSNGDIAVENGEGAPDEGARGEADSADAHGARAGFAGKTFLLGGFFAVVVGLAGVWWAALA